MGKGSYRRSLPSPLRARLQAKLVPTYSKIQVMLEIIQRENSSPFHVDKYMAESTAGNGVGESTKFGKMTSN